LPLMTTSADGSYSIQSNNGDGSYIVTSYDSSGDVTTRNYSTTGVLTSDNWTKSDGTYGNDVYHADGSKVSDIYLTDGSWYQTTTNAVGDIDQIHYAADGSEISEVIQKTDGSTVDTHYNSDGTYYILSNDGKGNISESKYSAAGVLTTVIWQKADGSYGSYDVLNMRNPIYTTEIIQNEGTTYNPDGSYFTYTTYFETSNNTNFTRSYFYTADGVYTGSSATTLDANPGDVQTSYTNASGRGTSFWAKSNGTSGIDVLNKDGSKTGQANYLDGSYSTYTDTGLISYTYETVTTTNYTAAGVETGYNTQYTDLYPYYGNKSVDTYYYTPDGTQTGSVNYLDFYDATKGSEIAETKVYSSKEVSDNWYDIAGGSAGTTLYNPDSSYDSISINSNALLENDLSATYKTQDALGNYSTITCSTTGVVTAVRAQNADGTYSITTNDQHGNITQTAYSTANVMTRVDWQKQDGAHGNYSPTGGTSYNADGTYATFTISLDATGVTTISTTYYSAEGVETGTSITTSKSYINGVPVIS
jgi:hypothetical protein